MHSSDSNGLPAFRFFCERYIGTSQADLLFSRFIELGIDLYIRFEDDGTLVHKHASNPHILRRLIEEGLSVNAPDAHGRTPLFWAATYHCEESVRLLMEVSKCSLIVIRTIHWQSRRGQKSPFMITMGS